MNTNKASLEVDIFVDTTPISNIDKQKISTVIEYYKHTGKKMNFGIITKNKKTHLQKKSLTIK